MGTRQNVWDNIWKDHQGKVVIWQRPNVWLFVWIAATALGRFLSQNTLTNILGNVAMTVLAIWAILELFSGVNYFRRTLGLVVLVTLIINRLF